MKCNNENKNNRQKNPKPTNPPKANTEIQNSLCFRLFQRSDGFNYMKHVSCQLSQLSKLNKKNHAQNWDKRNQGLLCFAHNVVGMTCSSLLPQLEFRYSDGSNNVTPPHTPQGEAFRGQKDRSNRTWETWQQRSYSY